MTEIEKDPINMRSENLSDRKCSRCRGKILSYIWYKRYFNYAKTALRLFILVVKFSNCSLKKKKSEFRNYFNFCPFISLFFQARELKIANL
jgi:hypothetical protein